MHKVTWRGGSGSSVRSELSPENDNDDDDDDDDDDGDDDDESNLVSRTSRQWR